MGVPQFWRLQQQNYRLVGEVCNRCGNKIYPPRDICPDCQQPAYEPYTFSGRGEVYSHTIVYNAPEGYSEYAPYAVALVKLEEGPLVTAQLTDFEHRLELAVSSYGFRRPSDMLVQYEQRLDDMRERVLELQRRNLDDLETRSGRAPARHAGRRATGLLEPRAPSRAALRGPGASGLGEPRRQVGHGAGAVRVSTPCRLRNARRSHLTRFRCLVD